MSSRDDLKNGEQKIEAFLTHLAVKKNVAPATTQNQAMNALVFLYKRVLKTPLKEAINAVRAGKKTNIPIVMTRDEVRAVVNVMEGVPQLMVKLLYGCGLRIMETVRLRVQDIGYKIIWPKFISFIIRIFPRGSERFICPMPSKGSIPMQTKNGIGNTCFPPKIFQRIQ